jgi:hypothetical protein
MTARRISVIVLTAATAILGCVVTFYGLLAVYKMDIRLNPFLSLAYCALPLLSFPIYFATLFRRKLAALLVGFAVAYLGVYSALDWRSCASVGICGDAISVIWTTFTTRAVLSYFGMAAGAWAAVSFAGPKVKT